MNPLIKFFRTKIYTALTLLVFILIAGVVGYKFISDYSWVDALYMTVITMTTVGFSEVNPLDTESKIFTIFLCNVQLLVYVSPWIQCPSSVTYRQLI